MTSSDDLRRSIAPVARQSSSGGTARVGNTACVKGGDAEADAGACDERFASRAAAAVEASAAAFRLPQSFLSGLTS